MPIIDTPTRPTVEDNPPVPGEDKNESESDQSDTRTDLQKSIDLENEFMRSIRRLVEMYLQRQDDVIEEAGLKQMVCGEHAYNARAIAMINNLSEKRFPRSEIDQMLHSRMKFVKNSAEVVGNNLLSRFNDAYICSKCQSCKLLCFNCVSKIIDAICKLNALILGL